MRGLFFRMAFGAALLAIVTGIGAIAEAKTATRSPGHWCSIRVKGLEIHSDIFYATVLPKRSLNIEIVPRSAVTEIKWHVSGGKLVSLGPYGRKFIAPPKSGLYPVEVRGKMGGKTVVARIKVFVIVPISKVQNGSLEGYSIGTYPAYNGRHPEIYQPPDGFIRITKENKEEYISENYKLGDFILWGSKQYPKFIVLDESLILKLEIVTHEFRRLGMMRGKQVSFLSTYRSPSHNGGGGQAKFSRHMWGAALDMYIDERGRPGWMDDLNRDGKIDVKDAIVMYKVIDGMSRRGEMRSLDGGLGIYPSTSGHGPFIHMDVRGNEGAIRWAKSQDGKRIKNVSAWLDQPENHVRMPSGRLLVAEDNSQRITNPPAAPSAPSPPSESSESLKAKIAVLEKEVMQLEEQAQAAGAGKGPVTKDDLYIAADPNSGAMLMNRGKVILRRVSAETGDPSPSCPKGLAGIYSVPTGIMEVRRNKLTPVWFHPPWALFGTELPGSYSQSRSTFYSGANIEAGIDLGGGAKIHSIDKKLKIVLPGCLGVAPEDLRAISSQVPVGTRVFLYKGDSSEIEAAESKNKRDLLELYAFLKLRRDAASIDQKYLLIDLDKNRAWIKQGDQSLRNFPVRRVGPNFSKAYPNAARDFRLPKGVFIIKSKYSNPPWYKPDWMFEEQDKKVPPCMGPGRVQTELLGKYGIFLGAGIVIHGIHDPKVPDRSIDYVALELKSEDLAKVWQALPSGGIVVIK